MNKLLAFLSVLSFFALAVIMFLVSPSEAGPFWIFIVFVLWYLFFYGLAVFCCKLFFLFRAKLNPMKGGNINAKALQYGVIIALAPELAIIMRANGVFAWAQVILILLVEIILCFVVSCSKY